MIRFLLVFLSLFIFSFPSIAQDHGYVNLGNLMIQLPEVEQADKTIRTLFNTNLEKRDNKAKVFQKKYQSIQKEVQKGTISQKEILILEQELKNEEARLIQEVQDMELQVQSKRKELMEPIYKKVGLAIEKIAKEKNLKMVFDISIPNMFIYVKDTDDITQEVLLLLKK